MRADRSGRSTREVVVFYTEAEPSFGHPSSEETLVKESDLISAVVGFWHQVERETYDRLTPFGVTTDDAIHETARLAQRAGARLAGLFHNLLYGKTSWSRSVIANLLHNLEAQTRLFADIGRTGLKYGYGEINVDIEHVEPAIREALSRFVERLTAHLHEVGLEVSISVPAKTWDDPEHGWSGGFDYSRIGQAVDRIYLMTYDEHGYSSGPGPIASSGWVESVVTYAVSQMPSHKVYVGIPGYGFDWTDGEKPRYISYSQAITQADELGAGVRRDEASNTPTYTYIRDGKEHEVWFEDAASSAFKLDLVESNDLGGIALWRAGLEDPKLWRAIARTFDVRKFETHRS